VGSWARSSENGSSVTPLVSVDQVNSLLEGVDIKYDQDGTENFFLVNSHVSCDVFDDSRGNEISLRILRMLVFSAVKQYVSTFFLSSSYELYDSVLEVFVANRSQINTILAAVSDLEALSFRDKFFDPFLGLSDTDNSRKSHASLSGSSKGSVSESIKGIFFISIRHEDSMIFGSHVALHTLVGSSTLLVDELSSLVSSNERNSSDVRMSADLSSCIETTLNDIVNTLGKADLLN